MLFLKVKSTHTRRIFCRVSGLIPLRIRHFLASLSEHFRASFRHLFFLFPSAVFLISILLHSFSTFPLISSQFFSFFLSFFLSQFFSFFLSFFLSFLPSFLLSIPSVYLLLSLTKTRAAEKEPFSLQLSALSTASPSDCRFDFETFTHMVKIKE